MRGSPRRFAVAVLALGLSGAGCRRASVDECEAILDRYVELTLTIPAEPAAAAATDKQALEALRAAERRVRRSEPGFTSARARCQREVSSRAAQCALKAGNANEWEACVQQ